MRRGRVRSLYLGMGEVRRGLRSPYLKLPRHDGLKRLGAQVQKDRQTYFAVAVMETDEAVATLFFVPE